MKTKNKTRYLILTVIGFVFLAAGLALIKLIPDAQGFLRALPYIFVGIGTGTFGQNLGSLLQIYALSKDPKAAKKIEIEEKDERNTAIRNKAKAKAYDLMITAYGALLLLLALMKEDVFIILAFVAVYLFIVFSNVYYFSKLQKEM
jgi:predicted histidine transporter YuiF (NhaC family)